MPGADSLCIDVEAPRPAPGGSDLTVNVTCHLSREDDAPTTRHPIRIASDWTVRTPHDIEGERVAAAFGGYTSCIDLVDTAVPAAACWLRRAMRADPPELEFLGRPDRWRLRRAMGCCPKGGFRDALSAAEHWRSPRHVAREHAALTRQVVGLIAAIRRAHAGHGTLSIPAEHRARAAECCLRDDLDVAWLWETGIHPRVVWQIHGELGLTARMPARLFLGVAWNRPDLHWVAGTLRGHDDPEAVYEAEQAVAAVGSRRRDSGISAPPADPLATWLAWSAANWDVVDPQARARWLGSGISRPLIVRLGEAGYDCEEVVAYGRAIRRTPDGAARVIDQWLQAGFHPTPGHLGALAAMGVNPASVPSRSAVGRLKAVARTTSAIWSDTDLALLLAEHGTVGHAARVLGEGAWPCDGD